MSRGARAPLVVWAWIGWVALSAARADAPAADASVRALPLLVRLAPTAHELHAARTRALEQRLAHTLAQLPGVSRAEVQLNLPLAAELALDRSLPAPAAAVVLQVEGDTPSLHDVWQLLRGSVPGLARENLALVARSATAASARAPSPLVAIGPFHVAAESAVALRVVLAVLLGTNLVLAVLLLWRASRAVVARTVARCAAKRFP